MAFPAAVRRQRPNLVLAIGLGLVVVSGAWRPARGQSAPEGEAAIAIRELEHAWVEGQARNNNGALNLIFDEALVYVEYGKLISKGEYLLRVRQAKPQPLQIVMEAMTVRIFGDTAIVVGSYRDKTEDSRMSGVNRWRFVDTWVYKKGRWMLAAAAAAPVTK